MIDELIKLVREGFMSITDHRKYNSTYSLGDLKVLVLPFSR